MGYTHYWEGPVTLTEETIADVKAIIAKSGVSIKGGDGTGEPELTPELICFNGDASNDEDYETFYIENESSTWTFCKTSGVRPYDKVVGAVLLRLADLNPQFTVTSDGVFDSEDWEPARNLYEEVFGRPANYVVE